MAKVLSLGPSYAGTEVAVHKCERCRSVVEFTHADTLIGYDVPVVRCPVCGKLAATSELNWNRTGG